MAIVTIQNSTQTLRASSEIQQFLQAQGLIHQDWPIPPSVAGLQGKATLTQEEQAQVLEAYRFNLERERAERGYIQADMVILSPSTPNLEEALAKFDRPHYHDDDEVRYIFDGEGVFGFELGEWPPFTMTVTTGDYIIIPARSYHWFTLTPSRSIKAIRLFKDRSGWEPHYKNPTD